jgi:hypothetical protein
MAVSSSLDERAVHAKRKTKEDPWQSFNGLIGGSEAQGAKADLTSTPEHLPRVTRCSLPYDLVGRP